MPAKVHQSVRYTLLGLVTVYFVVKTWPKSFYPHGPAVLWSSDRKAFAKMDKSNDSLQLKHGKTKRIYERFEKEGQKPLLVGPETVVFDQDGIMYILTDQGKLVSLTDFKDGEDGTTITAKTTLIKNLGVGRPLGGKFTNDGKTLYIADAILGLVRVTNPTTDPQSKVELVASSIVPRAGQNNNKPQPLLFVDDVCIGLKSGKVYFTDATSMAPDRVQHEHDAKKRMSWDLMYASLADFLRGKKSGRLLEYNPHTDQVTVLAESLHFANGVAVDREETFLFFAEMWSRRLWKYHLVGEKLGTLELVLENKHLAGYPDGTDCSWSKEGVAGAGKCYAAIPSTILPFHQFLAKLPDAVDLALRMIYLLLPRIFAPRINMYGGFVEVDPGTGEFRYIQDPTGKDMVVITGVTEHNGKLYLGSLVSNFIGVYDLAGDDETVKAE
jgi:sugar lactone lactonase YvrE